MKNVIIAAFAATMAFTSFSTSAADQQATDGMQMGQKDQGMAMDKDVSSMGKNADKKMMMKNDTSKSHQGGNIYQGH